MSNLLPSPDSEECAAIPCPSPSFEALPDRAVQLGALTVHRLLPVRGRRLIGPWCFLDRFGPLSFTAEKPMDVAPHPHIGLQTVTWLFSGEIIHNDSLDNECLVRPGQLSLMTAGSGIAHTEETPVSHSGSLDGVQFWVALPDASRHQSPHYQCTREQPRQEHRGALVTTILGAYGGTQSAGQVYSPAVALEVRVHSQSRTSLPLLPNFEYGLLLTKGQASANGQDLRANTLYYLGAGRTEFEVASRPGATLLLLGGLPFGETILMWWNFVARSPEEILAARQAWEQNEVFAPVPRYQGPRLPAPAYVGRPLKPASGGA